MGAGASAAVAQQRPARPESRSEQRQASEPEIQRLEGQRSAVVAPEALGAGDHVFVPRRLGGVRFQHHGIAVGAGHIAHYRWSVPTAEAAHEAQPARARIRLTSVADFLDGSVAPLQAAGASLGGDS